MPERDLALLQEAALAAGDIASGFFRQDPQKWDKGDGQGPVTEADLAVNEMLKSQLSQARPDYGWLSEETDDDEDRLNKEHVFIIDPIDGTRAFIEGSTTFAHSLAIARHGKVTAAVVHLPERDLTFTATRGQGAQLNGEAISATSRDTLKGATVLSNKANMKPELWPNGLPDIERHFRSSIAYRLCLVAQGRFDAMVTLRPTWEWDIAAGALIVEEAAGKIATQAGSALAFNNPTPCQPGVVAGSRAITDALLARL